MKTVILIISIFVSVALIVVLTITLNNYWTTKNEFDKIKSEHQKNMLLLENAKKQIIRFDAEKRQLAERIKELENELISAKSKLTSVQKDKDIAFSQSPNSISNQFKEALLTGQSIDEKIVKSRELGKMFVKMYSASKSNQSISSAEMSRQYAEVVKLMSDLGLNNAWWETNDYFSLLNNPEGIKVCANILAGIFDGSGQPMSDEQINRCELAFAKLNDFDKKITNENQNMMEKAIVRLQNADFINSLSQELSGIFTPEQRESFKNNSISGVPDILNLDSDLLGIRSTPLSQFKNQNDASQYVLDNWSTNVNASDEIRNNLKPVAEQYVKDYVTLKKNMELLYDKNIMDYYLQRNLPTDRQKLQSYYSERENLFQTNSEYKKAKTALDIEFLQLRSKYHKEVVRVAGPEKAASFVNGAPYLYHYPNIEQ
jgi:hypothetical protein